MVFRSIHRWCRLPRGKRIFCIYTYGVAKGMGAKEIARIAKEKGCGMMGEFGCRGYNTFGPFKLFGGTGKGKPDEDDLQRARAFIRSIVNRAGHCGPSCPVPLT